MKEKADNLFYVVKSMLFGFIAAACFLSVAWFAGAYYEEKAFIADYNDSAGGYYVFYEQNKEKQSEPLLIIKTRNFSKDLYVSEYGSDNWRPLKEEIRTMSGKGQIEKIKKDFLQQILRNHNNKYSPQIVEYRIAPHPSQAWIIYIRNYLKKLL